MLVPIERLDIGIPVISDNFEDNDVTEMVMKVDTLWEYYPTCQKQFMVVLHNAFVHMKGLPVETEIALFNKKYVFNIYRRHKMRSL
mgnify:CR=1 FL=1